MTGDKIGKANPKNNIIRSSQPDNLTREERESLKKLRNNQNIIIKPADKGSAVVVMNTADYIAEADRQLSDEKYYVRLGEPTYTQNIPKIKKILDQLLEKRFIDKKQHNYFSGPRDIKQRVFYLLPKIHKNVTSWPKPNIMPPGRPIISDVNSETYRISSYIDSFINPLSTGHPSYLKNSYEFVKKIKNFAIQNNYILVTGDIESLYTNMNLERSIHCVQKIFNENPDPARSDKEILEMLRISLKNNDFTFNGKFYLQTMGCAMGKRFAPALANIYLLEFDEKALSGFPIKPILFFRYLDDIFFLWPGSAESLQEYENFLNNIIPDIRVKLEHSMKEIAFLDVLIYRDSGLLKTKIYFKNTDKHLLLHQNSGHPKHTFLGLVKSQLIRFKRLSSNRANYNNTCKTLFSVLIKRGYAHTGLRRLQHQIWFHDGTTMQKNQHTAIIPIIFNYHPFSQKLTRLYKNEINESKIFQDFRLVTAFKTGPNLKQLLVKSTLPAEFKNYAFRTCGKGKCLLCKYHATDSTTFSSTNTKKSYKIRSNIHCNTKNIIYLITCRKCGLQYVGETERTLRERATDHRSRINKKLETPISIHFSQAGHSTLDMKIQPIEKVAPSSNPKVKRLERELFWQRKLQTIHPSGLNNYTIEKTK